MRGFLATKKINYPLLVGLCIMIFLMAVSLYPERFAASDPYGKETLQYEKGSGKFLVPPVPPGEDFIWGTDEKGRDLQSLIIYGCGTTLSMALTVAFGRLMIALPLAIGAACKNKFMGWLIRLFEVTFSAIPMIFIILILSRIQLFMDIFNNPMTIAVILMTVFGWSRLAKQLTKTIQEVLEKDFIEGEIAIGKSKWDIALQNVMPHTIPSMVVLFFLEVAVVLLLLSQVGALGLILSTGYVDEEFGNLNVPYEFDWASLQVFSYYLFSSYKTWLIIYPAAAFAMAIIGFNLLGEGIRMELEKRDSRVISFIKGLPGILSPFRLLYEMKNLQVYRKRVYIKLSVIFVLLLIFFFPQPQSQNPFDSVEAFAAVDEIGSGPFIYREYKVGKNVIAMNYVAEKLMQYGIEPFDNKYIHEMVTEEIPVTAQAEAAYMTEDSAPVLLEYKKDFIVAEPVDAVGSFELETVEGANFKDSAWIFDAEGKFKDKVMLIDVRGMEYSQQNTIINNIKYFIKPKGVVFIEDWNSFDGRGTMPVYAKGMGDVFCLLVASDRGKELLDQPKLTIKVDIKKEIKKLVLYANVMGIIPGKDEVLKNDIILIGSSLNDMMDSMGKGTHYALKAGGVASQLQLAKLLGEAETPPDRTVIFAFWDESIRFNKGAKVFSDQYINRSKNNIFYIDIGNLEGDKLIIDSSGIKPRNKKGQSYVRDLKESLNRNDIPVVFRPISNSSISTFLSSKQEVLAFDSGNLKYVIETKKKQKTAQVTGEDLLKFHKIGQMIIDTVFDIIYDESVQ